MEKAVGAADPITVLTSGLTNLQVSSVPTNSEPTTPTESPLSLDARLREWLTDLVAGGSNPKVYTKLLVSNAAAGSVIGKAGGNINDVQSKTYARIQLSKANEYFPGTTERTLLVTGRLKQVVAALALIFGKLLREGVAPLSPRSKAAAGAGGQQSSRGGSAAPAAEAGDKEGGDGDAPAPGPAEGQPQLRMLVRLLVPQPLCGVIIGRNGGTIKNYATDTGTVIRVTSGEASQLPTSHRIVTIAGEKEGVLKAIALMVLKQSDDPKFPLYAELPSPTVLPSGAVPYGGLGGAAGLGMPMPHFGGGLPPAPAGYMPPGMPSGAGSPGADLPAGFGMLPPVPHGPGSAANFTSLTLVLTEDQAGVLLDQGSRAVVEVEQMSGCRARLEMVDGPRGPFGRLMLAGTQESVGYAQWLLGQRLAAAASCFQFGGTTYYNSASMVAPPTGFAAVPPPAMVPPFMAAHWQHPAGVMQQQQQQPPLGPLAAGMAAMPMPLRQHSDLPH